MFQTLPGPGSSCSTELLCWNAANPGHGCSMPLQDWQWRWTSGCETVIASSSLQTSHFPSASEKQPRWEELQWQFLGKQPRTSMEHMERALKQGMEGVRLGLYRALSWILHPSRLHLWSNPACLSLFHSVEHVPVFIGQFHLLLIQFSNLFDFIIFNFYTCLAGHCSIQQSALWQT